MRVLYVAYPLQPVSSASCGGAEQVLWTLEREMHRRGVQTVAAACAGSEVCGELVVTGDGDAAVDDFAAKEEQHRERVLKFLRSARFDLVHDHSGHFWPHAGNVNAPVLATLHLPRTFYDSRSFEALAENVYFNCVSASQRESFADLPRMLNVVRNGIDIERFTFAAEKRGYLLWLGRICPEKAPHIAMDVARRGGVPLVVAGQVYPFSYHQQYFEREVRPRLANGEVAFVDTPSFSQKLELLQRARAVLITSTAQETSSMVALEAQACGTPVIARRIGALPEVVVDGATGVLVDSDDEFAAAIREIGRMDPIACRLHVEANFSARAMADAYERVYSRIVPVGISTLG
jgi:glycosyltransferase involved in cell wall biosynthesis